MKNLHCRRIGDLKIDVLAKRWVLRVAHIATPLFNILTGTQWPFDAPGHYLLLSQRCDGLWEELYREGPYSGDVVMGIVDEWAMAIKRLGSVEFVYRKEHKWRIDAE
jgi:hypothetical protein